MESYSTAQKLALTLRDSFISKRALTHTGKQILGQIKKSKFNNKKNNSLL